MDTISKINNIDLSRALIGKALNELLTVAQSDGQRGKDYAQLVLDKIADLNGPDGDNSHSTLLDWSMELEVELGGQE